MRGISKSFRMKITSLFSQLLTIAKIPVESKMNDISTFSCVWCQVYVGIACLVDGLSCLLPGYCWLFCHRASLALRLGIQLVVPRLSAWGFSPFFVGSSVFGPCHLTPLSLQD